MSDTTPDAKAPDDYTPPTGSTTAHALPIEGGDPLAYKAVADWVVLRKKEKPVAEVFHVAYLASAGDGAERPLTFVFNGGPGAASAYLHLGALGPKRVAFNADGTPPPPPARLVDNAQTWLTFTDLVFIDPVGTGFSRIVRKDEDAKGEKTAETKGPDAEEKAFYGLNRDIDSLGEFVQKFLSRHRRWGSAVFIAGESYGGFRVAKLARRLQEGYGVGLNGAIMISPALEWYLLSATDYDVLPWVGAVPTMIAAAAHHGRSGAFPSGTPLTEVLAEAERFVGEALIPMLAIGEGMPAAQRERTLRRMAELTGISLDALTLRAGRLDIMTFVRELLRDQRRILGLYDASITAVDPFPDRDTFAGADPTLFSIERVFTAGINAHLRQGLGLATERDYHLLNMEVNTAWTVDAERHAFDTQVGATDDLRYGMALNPHMQVFLTHGLYDLVTPYYANDRIVNLMKLDASLRANLHVQHFPGGHMFYTWDDSRRQFTEAIAAFVDRAVAR